LIWELADGSVTIGNIADEISSRYDVDPETVRQDAVEVLDDLESEGLIATSDSPVAGME
jgi:hypothetical protein